MILVPRVLIQVGRPCSCSQWPCCTILVFFLAFLQDDLLTTQANQPAKGGKNVSFPSTRNPTPSTRKHQLVRGSRVWRGGGGSGSLAVCGAAKEAVRALHLTAPLSEPSLPSGTIPCCHLQLRCELILPSRVNSAPPWTRREKRRSNQSQMCGSSLRTKQFALISTSNIGLAVTYVSGRCPPSEYLKYKMSSILS